jgi:hypothetical protein
VSADADEFFVGYQPRVPAGLARALRVRVLALLLLVAGLAAVLANAHAPRPPARFEYGAPVELRGTLVTDPYPTLMVQRPGRVGMLSAVSRYPLVAPWKHGADALVAGFAGRAVSLRATLAYRDGQVVVSLGRRRLTGEIVDSKCFAGVMNPGELKPHRACAVRCISGGIPPVLCVRDAAGRASWLLLVSADGAPVNAEVLDLVAEPVEITGEVLRTGDQLVLRADPATYRRLE